MPEAPGNVLYLTDSPLVDGKLCFYSRSIEDIAVVGVLWNVPKDAPSRLPGTRIDLPGTDAASIDRSQGLWLGVVVGDWSLVIWHGHHPVTDDQAIAMANRILGLG